LAPSSQVHHSPLTSIQSWATLGADILLDHAIIVGMSGSRLCSGFFMAVGNERLLPGHGEESPSRRRQQLGPVSLKPCLVPPSALILCLEPGDCHWVGDFLDDELGFHRASSAYMHVHM